MYKKCAFTYLDFHAYIGSSDLFGDAFTKSALLCSYPHQRYNRLLQATNPDDSSEGGKRMTSSYSTWKGKKGKISPHKYWT